MEDKQKKEPQKNSRRDALKGLIGLPLAGGVLWGAMTEARKRENSRREILEYLNINATRPEPVGDMSGDPIRVGIIGFGGRGSHLVRVLGFATQSWLEDAKKQQGQPRLQSFLEQENLNVKLTGVCDPFSLRTEEAAADFPDCKVYRNHEEMIASPDIDAVIIATPDHWHAPIAIAALEANKHVYVEKPMTHNIEETYALREAARNSKGVFQVGHQHRQTLSFITAQDVIKRGLLGHINLVQTNTNRNSDTGAWQYHIHEKASPKTINWDQFLGNAPKVPFNKEHFFRWRKWWAYGSGLSGDLMSHDYDRVNCVLSMGMPQSITATGGIYTHNDGREVPDVFNVCMEYPQFSTGSSREKGLEKGMTFMYSATLGNSYNRGTLFMGHDGTMELGNTLTIWADRNSTRYKDMLDSGKMNASTPIYAYNPMSDQVDGVTSATAKYFADKGLLWTYRDGRRVDSAMLHMREWLGAIRNGTPVSCGIDEGFEEAMTAHMAGVSWKAGRRVDWDPIREEIIALPGEDLDKILLSTKVDDHFLATG
ncbi:MAG TPA: Gfo/Idh/MocA family oxidoreductase [Saprospiraceae bacterium]|nr:Gfo/Idh/MocA family oxidoreductase [Saprospiraceae bacterium]